MNRAYGVGDAAVKEKVVEEEIEVVERDDDGSQGEIEARQPRAAARPYTPTKREVEEHETTHLPFRSWCKHCVFAKGISSAHRGRGEEERLGITISIDYCFMNPKETEEGVPPVLVMWDNNHKAMWAIPVEAKGPFEYVVK